MKLQTTLYFTLMCWLCTMLLKLLTHQTKFICVFLYVENLASEPQWHQNTADAKHRYRTQGFASNNNPLLTQMFIQMFSISLKNVTGHATNTKDVELAMLCSQPERRSVCRNVFKTWQQVFGIKILEEPAKNRKKFRNIEQIDCSNTLFVKKGLQIEN